MPNQNAKLSESTEREKNQRDDLILASIAEGLCVINEDEKLGFINRAAEKMFGENDEAVRGRHYEEIFFHRPAEFSDDCPIRFALREGETSHVKNETFFRSGGGDFSVEYICVPLIENGRVTGAVLTFEDVTERRDVERAIAEVRDAALENARVRAAFLANMSHEIRTPLNGIIGTTNLLSDTSLDERQKNFAGILKTSAQNLLAIVNDMLDFSKLEAGEMPAEIIVFNLSALLTETVRLFENLAQKKQIRFRHSFAENIPTHIFGDQTHLRQVLTNLLNNALKFTEQGEILLEIFLQKEEGNIFTIEFSVADTGIGIGAEKIGTLFHPFVQADVSTTRRFGGTGLGLAICKGIVEKMGGEIGIESSLGKGSRFWFTAEFERGSETAAGKNVGENPTASEIHFARGLRVLMVEDNLINSEIGGEYLLQIGITPEFAGNGAEALEKCRTNAYDLILMDCQMPEMDGFEASEKILALARQTPPPKIIALTAASAEAEKDKCFAAGMSDFLIKPMAPHDLIKIFNKYFSAENPLKNIDLEGKLVQHSVSEIIFPEILQNLRQIEKRGNENFVSEMLNLYLEYAESGLVEMKTAAAARAIGTIKQKAHSLKGSSANIGAIGMNELFESLENNLAAENWLEIEKDIIEIAGKLSVIKMICQQNL